MTTNQQRLVLLWLMLATLCGGLLARGANVYIRDGGSGDGSAWNNALDDLPATLTRGNIYYVADGVYAGYTFDDAGTSLITVRKATAADHGTETGWSSTYGDGVATWGNITFAASNIEFNGATGGGPTNWNGGHGFTMSSTSDPDFFNLSGLQTNITIKHVSVDSDRGAAVNPTGVGSTGYGHFVKGISGGADITVSHCAATEIFGVMFHIGSWTNCIIERSYFYYNRSTADQHSEGVSSIGFNNNVTWRWNLWDKIEGTAVFAGVNTGVSRGWKIYGNIITRSATPIYYYWEPSPGTNPHEMYDLVFHNNTIIGCPGYSQGGLSIGQGSNNVAYNNLFYANDANSFNISPTHNYTYASDNIRSADGPFDKDADILTGEANGQNGSGSPFASYNADPLLADLSATTSAGATLSSPFAVDMYGTTRTLWTRGAIEQGSGPGAGGGQPAPITPVWTVTNLRIGQ